MNNLLKRKLTGHKGESIAESLVSILVVAIASIMFAGMVTASYNIINKSSDWMQDYYSAVSAINAKTKDDDAYVSEGHVDVDIGGLTTKQDLTAYSYTVGGVDIISYVPVEPSPSPEPAGG